MQSTFFPRSEDIKRRWYVLDAAGKPLGRVAVAAARVLRGKHKPDYTPYVDTGDHVVIVNAQKVVLTGKKLGQKMYFRHSGYPGGVRMTSAGDMRAHFPERMIRIAVQGMLPHNRLGRAMIKKLKVYRGAEHPHAAQRPEPLSM
ncbi:MAG TPA: 50S ribosomal protein L13 [Firmicutes bacterium]|nr:50S ribosomal protein L13 [Bacillota bacterium]